MIYPISGSDKDTVYTPTPTPSMATTPFCPSGSITLETPKTIETPAVQETVQEEEPVEAEKPVSIYSPH